MMLEHENVFDNSDKDQGWHTALYYFAEHVRVLSSGTVNHKMLYAHIGTKGYYINHENPLIRKRTAAALSRMIHSCRYAEDMRASYLKDQEVFERAAAWLLEQLRRQSNLSDEELMDRVAGPLLADVGRGLENERASGRRDLNIIRVLNEADAVLSWSASALPQAGERFEAVTSSLLYLMAFGHLEEKLVQDLSRETPLHRELSHDAGNGCRVDCACLIKYVNGAEDVVSDMWLVDGTRSFSIGRYTDCDVIETNRYASRLHCALTCREGRWILEDLGSKNGTQVLEGDGRIVFDSRDCESAGCEIEFGQRIVLAESSHYWFGAVNDEGCCAAVSVKEHERFGAELLMGTVDLPHAVE